MKKYLLTFSLLLSLITSPLSATTLWDFYNGNLPSISARGEIYKDIGDDKYTGTATQNINLLSYLLGDKPFPNDPSFTDQSIVFGATLPSGTPLFETALQSQITTSATTMTLTANATSGGGSLSGYNCFTIDEGSAQAEYVCGTVSGTSVTSLLRGVDPMTATTTNASLQFAHRRGANVKITDFPLIQLIKHQLSGEDTFQNLLYYSQNNTFSSSTQLVSKGYVDGVAVAGAPNADTSTKGIVEIATTIETASSTATGSTGATIVVSASQSTSTPVTGCNGTTTVGALCNVIARNNGTIDPNYISTSSTYNFGGQIFLNSRTDTIASSTQFVINAGQINSTSTPKVNGVALVTPTTVPQYSSISQSVTNTTGVNLTATTTVAGIAGGVLTGSSTMAFFGTISFYAPQVGARTCAVKVGNQVGTPFVSYTVSNAGSGLTYLGSIQGIVASNNSLSAQKSSMVGTLISGTGSSVLFSQPQVDSTSAIDISVATSITINVLSNANDVLCSLSNFSIVINP